MYQFHSFKMRQRKKQFSNKVFFFKQIYFLSHNPTRMSICSWQSVEVLSIDPLSWARPLQVMPVSLRPCHEDIRMRRCSQRSISMRTSQSAGTEEGSRRSLPNTQAKFSVWRGAYFNFAMKHAFISVKCIFAYFIYTCMIYTNLKRNITLKWIRLKILKVVSRTTTLT